MEAFGLVPNLEKEADRIARMGYIAIAPDVYTPGLPTTPRPTRTSLGHGMMRKLDDAQFLDDMRARSAACARCPKWARSDRAVTGFCWRAASPSWPRASCPARSSPARRSNGGGIGPCSIARSDPLPSPPLLRTARLLHPRGGSPAHRTTAARARPRLLVDNYEGAVHGFCCRREARLVPCGGGEGRLGEARGALREAPEARAV